MKEKIHVADPKDWDKGSFLLFKKTFRRPKWKTFDYL